MLEVSIRNSKVKCRKFRNVGLSTGTLRRKTGEIIPISLKTNKLDQYINNNGLKENLEINFKDEVVKVKIQQIHRHVIFHNAINVDFIEL